jgi:hypothetical protein
MRYEQPLKSSKCLFFSKFRTIFNVKKRTEYLDKRGTNCENKIWII